MRWKIIFFIFYGFSFISYGQYCTNGGPTATADSNVESVLLLGDVGSINLPNACPAVTGVEDLTTNQSTSLSAGSSYDLIVQFGTCGGNYAGYGEAWIDFNGDAIFDFSESIGTWQGTPPTAISTMTFTVPVGTTNGITRLRVMQREGNTTLPLDPCATFSWGSVMDFGIDIIGGIDCSGYSGDDINDAIVVNSLPYLDSNDNSYCYSNQNYVYASPDIYYRLIPEPNVASINASTCGSSFDTFISAVTPSGNVIAFNDDGLNCGSSSQIMFNVLNYDTIFIIVEGWGSEMGNFVLNINSSLVGIENLINSKVLISPNPASDYIQIQGFEGDVQILDIFGKVVAIKKYLATEKLLLQDLTSGVYFVHMQTGTNSLSRKIIIRH